MKKIFLVVVMVSAIVAGAFGQSGVIREINGEVELKSSGASSFTTARVGATVARDTVVSTGFKSTAVIAIGSSTITVRPLTRLSLAEIQSASGSENLNVNLQTGRVRVEVKPPAGAKASTTIQSPGATASVRGTTFEFDTVNLSVVEGKVAFATTSSGVATMVQGGESSFVGADGQPVSPVEVKVVSLLPDPPVGAQVIKTVSDSPEGSGDVSLTIEYEKK